MTHDEIVAGAHDSIRHGSKSFRAASRLFDPATRERAWLLYCWCRHCDDVADGQTYGFGRGIRGANRGRQAVEDFAQRQDQPVVQRVAFGGAGQADHRDLLCVALKIQFDVGVAHAGAPSMW